MHQRKTEAIWIESERRWSLQIQRNGFRKTFHSSVQGRKGKIDCENKADEWLETAVSKDNIKVEDLFDSYIDEMKRFGKSYYQYESFGKTRIIPVLGRKRIGSISEQDLQEVIHIANDDGLSKKSQKNLRGCMTAFMKYCRKCGATKLVPADIEIHSDAYENEKRSLQPDEIKILFSSDKTLYTNKVVFDRYIYCYRFAVCTGLRPSELLGLKWTDINDKTVTISRGINSNNIETSGKNKNAHRTFVLTNTAYELLNKQRDMLKEERNDSERVFPWRFGNFTTQDNLYKAWKRYTSYNEITPISLYELRHTFVSINKTMPIEYLKMIAGHSSSMNTTDTYGHVLDGETDIASRLVQSNLDKILE